MPQDDIGAHLKSLRLKAGYESLGSLSRASGVTVATLSRIESGGQKPNPETLEKLAPFLKVSHEELMTEAGYLKPLSGKSKLKTSNLQGRTDNITHTNNLTPKEERDIARDLDRILSDLESNEALAFDGEPLDDETKALMKVSLENSMRLAKQIAKNKFTPKKYK